MSPSSVSFAFLPESDLVPTWDDNEIVTTNGPTVRGGAVRRFPANDGRG